MGVPGFWKRSKRDDTTGREPQWLKRRRQHGQRRGAIGSGENKATWRKLGGEERGSERELIAVP